MLNFVAHTHTRFWASKAPRCAEAALVRRVHRRRPKMSAMDTSDGPAAEEKKDDPPPPRFEIKKWNAV